MVQHVQVGACDPVRGENLHEHVHRLCCVRVPDRREPHRPAECGLDLPWRHAQIGELLPRGLHGAVATRNHFSVVRGDDLMRGRHEGLLWWLSGGGAGEHLDGEPVDGARLA